MSVLVRCGVVLVLLATVGLVIQDVGSATSASQKPVQKQDDKKQSDKKQSDDQKDQKSPGALELKKFMRAKLTASNQVLEGLVTDDLKLVKKGSGKMLSMSRGEKWLASNDPLYRQYSMQFRNAVTRLKVKSESGSLDGAALAWMDVTHSCIRCHEWLRNTVIVEQF